MPPRLHQSTGLIALALLATAGVAKAGPADGLWRSRGYGMIAEIKAGQTTLYDVTAINCVRQPPLPGLTDGLFETAEASADGQHLTSKAPWGLTRLYFDRISALPSTCGAPTPDAHDPLYNFDVFWNIFNDYYAFFKERGVDWSAVRTQYRPQITSRTTDAELVEIIRSIFRQLQDRHVTLSAGAIRLNAGSIETLDRWNAEYAQDPRGSRSAFLHRQIVTYLSPAWARYLDAGSVRQVSGNVTTGAAHGGQIGYAMIAAEEGYAESGELEEDKQAATDQLDRVFAGFAGKRGLILDMRINDGGHDDVALALAGLLTAQERPGLSKCTRDGDGYTPIQHTVIHPRANAFTGPVVILVSPLTWSSGENLAMMAKDFPNVVVVGDRTASVHSDVLIKSLPNGWRLTLSDEVFGASDGSMYESAGVPPDVLVPYDPDQVRETGVDPLMEKALHLLNSVDFDALAAGAKRGRPTGRQFPCDRSQP